MVFKKNFHKLNFSLDNYIRQTGGHSLCGPSVPRVTRCRGPRDRSGGGVGGDVEGWL